MKFINKINKKFRLPLIILVILGVVLAGIGISRRSGEEVVEETNKPAEVSVKAFRTIAEESFIEKRTVLKAKQSSVLVARTGGRITAVNANIGDNVKGGSIVVEIDGGFEASPARAQLAGANASLAALSEIEKEGLAAADNGIVIAKLSADSAKETRPISLETQKTSREAAQIALQNAEINAENARKQNNDSQIKAANLAVHSAKLALEQVRLAEQLTSENTSTAAQTAKQNLAAAKINRERIAAEFKSQRASLVAQRNATAETIRLSHVTAAGSGQVIQLNARVGQYVNPGEVIGEILTDSTAEANLSVSQGTQQQLREAQTIELQKNGVVFEGIISRIASQPGSNTLYQVDITIPYLPKNVTINESVIARIPVHHNNSNSTLIPLDLVSVRQAGLTLFTIKDSGFVSEQSITPLRFTGDFIETSMNFAPDTLIVVSGQRTLRDGEEVEIISN